MLLSNGQLLKGLFVVRSESGKFWYDFFLEQAIV